LRISFFVHKKTSGPEIRVVKLLHLIYVALFLVATGCGSALNWTPEHYVVRPGDTLYSISFDYRLDQRDLVAWNRLGDGSVIYVGQKLRLTGPANKGRQANTSGSASSGRSSPSPVRKTARPVAVWQWPTDGAVIGAYGSSSKTKSGVQIGGRNGQPVRAAAGGEVVYSGSGLAGYGQLLIVKHNENYLSAYGHNDSLLVSEGERVNIGQQIAKMGMGPGRRAMLHFEIRRDGAPVDPASYLPPR
jgi:lipoprotein NlpD